MQFFRVERKKIAERNETRAHQNRSRIAEIRNTIAVLKNQSTKDIYNISTHLLKKIKLRISQYLAEIFNKCVVEGVFPDKLKVAKVIPAYKKGDRSNCEIID